MDDGENRIGTIILACMSLASLGLFLAVYGPPALAAPPGTSFRAMSVVPLLALVFGWFFWVAPIVMGVLQLFRKPRVFGLLSIGIGVLHFIAIWLFQWLVMFRRGITWGS